MTAARILAHQAEHSLADRLRGQAFIPGVHFASQAQVWMSEAADLIDVLQVDLAAAVERLGVTQTHPWHDHDPSEGVPTGWHRHPGIAGWSDVLHCHEPDASFITIERPDAASKPPFQGSEVVQ